MLIDVNYRAPMTNTLITPVRQVQEYGASLPVALLECRSDGHEWCRLDARIETSREKGLYGTWFKSKRCRLCQGIKMWWVDFETGRVLKTQRVYPEGYQRRGEGRIGIEGKSALRRLFSTKESEILAQSLPIAPRKQKSGSSKKSNVPHLIPIRPVFQAPEAERASA